MTNDVEFDDTLLDVRSLEAEQSRLTVDAPEAFVEWLRGCDASIAVTTYQTGRLLLLSAHPERPWLITQQQVFRRCLGVAFSPQTCWISTRTTIERLVNVLPSRVQRNTFDRWYVPRSSWHTGPIDTHDVAIDGDGEVIFCNTLYSCLATVDATRPYAFRPLWRPPFLSELSPDDRCHLNGLAMVNGRAAYVTFVAETDTTEGWREHRTDGGVVYSIVEDAAVVRGLSMPHSPRVHNERLYVLNSGAGEFGRVDLQRGVFEPIARCAGYARGLAFLDGCAVVGLSRPRPGRIFSGLPLEREGEEEESLCGLQVFDLESGRERFRVRIGGRASELYDVQVLCGCRHPRVIDLQTDEPLEGLDGES